MKNRWDGNNDSYDDYDDDEEDPADYDEWMQHDMDDMKNNNLRFLPYNFSEESLGW